MARQLDLTALRSFVAVIDMGGVTRAAGALNLTQSAVSMQLKRLEENLGVSLLDRTARRIGLTATGEQLLGQARKLLALNDEVLGRLVECCIEGEIKLGVPADVIYPVVPQVLRAFGRDYPRVKVTLVAGATVGLKEQFEKGEVDLLLTTETETGPGGVAIAEMPLVWVGAVNGTAWKTRPLPLAFEYRCMFRQSVQRALDEADISWTMAVEADSSRAVGAMVAADLAVCAMLERVAHDGFAPVPHGGALPELERYRINLYGRRDAALSAATELGALLKSAFGCL